MYTLLVNSHVYILFYLSFLGWQCKSSYLTEDSCIVFQSYDTRQNTGTDTYIHKQLQIFYCVTWTSKKLCLLLVQLDCFLHIVHYTWNINKDMTAYIQLHHPTLRVYIIHIFKVYIIFDNSQYMNILFNAYSFFSNNQNTPLHVYNIT